MVADLRRAVLFTLVTMLLFGGVYPAVLWGIGQAAFPDQAAGSLIRRADATVAGSSLIAQRFTRPEYFRSRPSAVDYDAASSGGSNRGPSNPSVPAAARTRIDAIVADEAIAASDIPSEMVTASGSGLDPHIPPRAAEMQVARVARARGMSPDQVRELVLAQTQPPLLGLFGRERVHVLELNLALDERSGRKR